MLSVLLHLRKLRSDHPIPDSAGWGPAFGSGRSAIALCSAHVSKAFLVPLVESAKSELFSQVSIQGLTDPKPLEGFTDLMYMYM